MPLDQQEIQAQQELQAYMASLVPQEPLDSGDIEDIRVPLGLQVPLHPLVGLCMYTIGKTRAVIPQPACITVSTLYKTLSSFEIIGCLEKKRLSSSEISIFKDYQQTK